MISPATYLINVLGTGNSVTLIGDMENILDE